MKDETRINLVDLLGEEKANFIFKQTEDTAKLHLEKENDDKARLDRMTKAMIDKSYLISGEYYNGYRWRGKHVAMWDGESGKFKSIKFEMGMYGVETIPYFGDIAAESTEDGFIPFDRIEPRKIR